ncbi:bacteriocin immunity protein [Sodalis sp. RH19]|uniref:bacteriocin immunity protein n=1 Tax=unclassified Sodalis (in: enterobacteria) TaxID=2636512 RepID=UPI0039B53B36
MLLKENYEDYTEQEFLEFLGQFFNNTSGLEGDEYSALNDRMILHFKKITEHPYGSDVIYYPDAGREDSPRGVLQEVKEWRAKNGKPGFKQA